MRKTHISFEIELDGHNIPSRIQWTATDKPTDAPSETKSIHIALWDTSEKNTLSIFLWTREMPVYEMKRFYIDCLGSMAQGILQATGDSFFAGQTHELCEKLVEQLRTEASRQDQEL